MAPEIILCEANKALDVKVAIQELVQQDDHEDEEQSSDKYIFDFLLHRGFVRDKNISLVGSWLQLQANVINLFISDRQFYLIQEFARSVASIIHGSMPIITS